MTACRKRSNKTSLTLKCRHGDRYFVQSRVVIAEDAKFEEDLKPRFTHLFSYSRKAEADAPKDVDALIDLFPDMKNCMGEPPAGSSFELVRDFVAIERIYSGLKVELSESFDAECAVVVWYDRNNDDDETPVVIETRPACGGVVRIIVCIEDRHVIESLPRIQGQAQPRQSCESYPHVRRGYSQVHRSLPGGAYLGFGSCLSLWFKCSLRADQCRRVPVAGGTGPG